MQKQKQEILNTNNRKFSESNNMKRPERLLPSCWFEINYMVIKNIKISTFKNSDDDDDDDDDDELFLWYGWPAKGV